MRSVKPRNDDAGGVLGVGLGVEEGGEGDCHRPRAIFERGGRGCVCVQYLGGGVGWYFVQGGVWGGVTAAALVKADEAIYVKVVEGCDGVGEAVTGSAVKVDDRVAVGVAV